MKRAFTLLELIVVIVILGILATLGFTQYNKTVEKGRQAEAIANLGMISQLVKAYKLANNTSATITAADVNIGSGAGQIPSTCDSQHYFYYKLNYADSDHCMATACRCTSGGKTPQGSNARDQALALDYIASATVTERWGVPNDSWWSTVCP